MLDAYRRMYNTHVSITDRLEMQPDGTKPEIEPTILARWNLSPLRSLGGRVNEQWLVKRGSERAVLRRYASVHSDIDYEVEVLRRLAAAGWPVPRPMEEPISHAGEMWCLFSFLPGMQATKAGPAEQRVRGRLLAELHDATATWSDMGQRTGFDRSDAIIFDPALTTAIREYERIQPDVGRLMRWHIDRAHEQLDDLDLANVEQIVLHSDFAS